MKATAPERVRADIIVSSAEFLDGFVPPDYVIDGLVQRRFCYSLTAPTGHAKTAIALRLSALKALGQPLGAREIDAGRVLYLVGENPDDVRMRWLVLSETMAFDPKTIDVHFLPGTAKLSELGPVIRSKIQQLGGVSLVVVDTSAAYYEGDEENGNVQAGAHARLMRSFVTLPGEPCVLVLCHPVKNAGPDNLLPRGGGAFIAEVDGNLTCWKTDSTVSLHWQGKFRGPDFAPITFELKTVTSPNLLDSKGRSIPSVIARVLSDQERVRAEASSSTDEDALLLAIADTERASLAGLAMALGWLTSRGENKTKVKRCADRLKADKLVKPDRRGTLCLTDRGETEVKRLRANSALNGRRVSDDETNETI
jgi:AAA domain